MTTPTTTATDTDTDTHDLRAMTQHWAAAFNAGDLPTLMATYEPDAIIVPGPDAEPMQGLAAIESALRAFLSLGGRLNFTPRYWLVSGDTALGSSAFSMDDGRDPDGNPVPLAGITAEVARRQPDGSWKYVLDHPFGGNA